jgi:hypothetical protein
MVLWYRFEEFMSKEVPELEVGSLGLLLFLGGVDGVGFLMMIIMSNC